VTVPRPVTAQPVDDLTFTDSVEFDRVRCYEVRAVRGTGPDAVESAPSERRCVMLVDVFAPAPPTNLATVVRPGAIDLIWESSPDLDVWGYVILRGTAGDATLQPLNAAPVIDTQFTDTTVTADTRYVYAVMAVDTRLPLPNISAESARIEETAR
jgi:fibronectin type 3 domain-containing protein